MIRIGHNPNTNMLPMFYFLPRNHSRFEWVTAEPTGHNSMLAQGQIDMAPISSFSYGQHWEDYAILPNLSVSNTGRVGSILLLSRIPITNLAGETIALTTQSATSVNLLKIIVHHYYGLNSMNFIKMEPNLEKMLESAQAALLIGDSAIKAYTKAPDLFVYDLGQEWLDKTGYPMTYAVWAYRRRLIEERPEEVLAVYKILIEAKEKALRNFDSIISESKRLVGLDEKYWMDYFARFSYDLNEDSQKGLKHYFAMCYELNLLPNNPDLFLWPIESNS